MTETKRRYNPKWKDSKEARNRRTRQREADLLAKLQAAGWKSKSEFLTAIINGVIAPPSKP